MMLPGAILPVYTYSVQGGGALSLDDGFTSFCGVLEGEECVEYVSYAVCINIWILYDVLIRNARTTLTDEHPTPSLYAYGPEQD
jgi:hypothetical protein